MRLGKSAECRRSGKSREGFLGRAGDASIKPMTIPMTIGKWTAQGSSATQNQMPGLHEALLLRIPKPS